MAIKIIRGESLLTAQALQHEGKIYLPLEALAGNAGTWGNLVLYNTPLAGKRIIITILSSATRCHELPLPLKDFIDLCKAAGARVVIHHGGKIPCCDLVIAIEPGGRQIFANYLGMAWRSRPLAQKVCTVLKQGLQLAYLPDPVPFRKPQYNLRLTFWTRWRVPAIVLQWPDDVTDLGGWLFSALIGYFGSEEPDGNLFIARQTPLSPAPAAQTAPPVAAPAPVEVPAAPADIASPPQQAKQSLAKAVETVEPLQRAETRQVRPGHTPAGKSAAMSRVQYPEFFAILDKKRKQKPRRRPFG